jgi:tripartite-type tricarboxylate transporter receptor subunit TctC
MGGKTMTKHTSGLLAGVAAVALAGLMPMPAAAFPDQPVNYIIPFDPGGESDVSARLQQPYFAEITGQDLIIQYLPGAGGASAWSGLNEYEGDGYTIMGTNLPHIVLQPLLQDPGYETDDIVNVYIFHFTPDALIVRADSPYETLEDFIEAANEAPGALTASGSGTNSANDVANQLFENETGAIVTYIPYSGTAPSVTALLGGETDAAWGYTTVAAGQGDQVRTLAVAMEERHPNFPDVPTFRELGYDIVGGAYRGIAVPDSTPEDRRQEVSDLIAEINADPDFISQMEEAGFAMIDVPYAEAADWMEERKAFYSEIAEQLAADR